MFGEDSCIQSQKHHTAYQETYISGKHNTVGDLEF